MFTTLLIDTVNVTRPTIISYDDYGNSVVSYSTIYSAIKCRIVESTGIEDTDNRNSTVRNAKGFFDNAHTLTVLDRVIFGADTYEVSAPPIVYRNSTSMHHTEVDLELVTV